MICTAKSLRPVACLKRIPGLKYFCSLSTLASSTRTNSAAEKSPTQPNVELFQYAICPFCNRVKVFLDYAGITYKPIEVNPLTKAEIKWSKEYRKVPIAKVDEVPYNGSDAIISGLLQQPQVVANLQARWEQRCSSSSSTCETPQGPMTLSAFAQSPSAQQWVTFANEELAPLLYPNICRTLTDAYGAFAYVEQVDTFRPWQRIAIRGIGSLAMYMAAAKVKRRRNITDERQALDDALTHLESGLAQNKPFLSGSHEPHLGDLVVFGTLRAISGMPALHEQIMDDSHRRGHDGTDSSRPLQDWYQLMTDKIAK